MQSVKWRVSLWAGLLVAAVLVFVTPTPASAGASVSPGGATVTAGQGTTARATFTPSTGTITCGAVSGGGNGVSATLDQSGCRDQAYSTTLRISTSSSAAPGTYTITVQDTADGNNATFTLTVRAAATTTTSPPTTTPPPTVVATTTPPTTAAPPPTTEAPTTTAAPTTTVPPTTTTAPVDPGAFASVTSLVGQGLPEEGVFLPFVGAGYRECLPLTKACSDPDSALMVLPARSTSLAWGPEAEGVTPLPRVDVRSVPPLQPVGDPASDQPAGVNYLLTMVDLVDGGQPKALARGLNADGELVAATADQAGVVVQQSGVEVPENVRTFLASQPFRKPFRLKTANVSEAAPAIPLFLGTQQRVVYLLRADPSWGLNADVIPLLGNGNVPYLVRTTDGATGLLVPIPPGLTLSDRSTTVSGASSEDDDGGGSSILPILLGVVVLAALVAGAVALVRWRRQRAIDREHEAARARAEAIIRSQPKRFGGRR